MKIGAVKNTGLHMHTETSHAYQNLICITKPHMRTKSHPVTSYQGLNPLPAFHEIRNRSSSQEDVQ